MKSIENVTKTSTIRRSIGAAVAALGLAGAPFAGSANATPGPEHREAICHNTSSATNPWVAIEVDVASLPAHFNLHGDFLYEGPVKPNGHPDHTRNIAGNWCVANAIEAPEEPEVITPEKPGNPDLHIDIIVPVKPAAPATPALGQPAFTG